MKIRKLMAVLAAAALSAACLAGTAFADGAPSVSVSAAEAAPGATATVSVSLSGAEDVGSFGMILDYDKSKLELTGMSAGPLCSGGYFSGNPATGKAGYFGSKISGGGVLFTATFKVLDQAPSSDVPVSVSVTVDEMTTYAGDAIDAKSVAVSAGELTAKHQHASDRVPGHDADGHWSGKCACGEEVYGYAAHSMTKWVEDLAATYEHKGTGHYECAECGWWDGVTTVDIPKLHRCEFDESAWCCDESGHWHPCKAEAGCPEQGDYAEHDFGEWAEAEGDLLPAGAASAKVRSCSVCGYAEYADVVNAEDGSADGDASKSDGDAAGKDASKADGTAKTGDAAPVAAAACGAIALAAACGVAVARRNRDAA